MRAAGLAVLLCIAPAVGAAAPVASDATAIRAAAKARLAEESGDARGALAALVAVASIDPARPGLRGRMLQQALIAGDQRRATEAAQALWLAGEQRFDARIVLLVDAARRGDWKAARGYAGDEAAKVGPDFTARLVSPVVLGWIDVATRERAPTRHLNRLGRIGEDQTPLWIGATMLLLAGERDAALGQAERLNLGNRTSRFVAARLATTLKKHGENAAADGITQRLAAYPDAGFHTQMPLTPVGDARQGIGQWFGLLGDGFARTPNGNIDLALLFTRAGHWLDPADPVGRFALAEALIKAEQADSALALLEQGSKTVGRSDPFALRRAELLAERGQVAEAIALAAPDPAQLPDDRTWLIRFADIARQAEDAVLADAVFDKLLALPADPASDPSLRAALLIAKAEIKLKQNRWAEAEPLLEAALAANPTDPGTLNFVGYSALERRDNVPQALARIEAAWRADSGNAAITDSLGWAYVLTGDVARGLPLLERAARGEPANNVINEHLGDALWKSGRLIEARYAWRSAALGAEPAMAERLAAKIAGGLTEATLAP
jgi:tetratricopeptide (TPR) repeat protein